MTSSLNHLLRLLSHDPTAAPITPTQAVELSDTYPFFTLPAIMALRDNRMTLMPPEVKQKLMGQIALNSSDPQRDFLLADVDYASWLNFYPSESPRVTTDDAISKFLETYGHSDPREEALLERLIFNPTPDYASVLERRDREEGTSLSVTPQTSEHHGSPTQDDLINSFILKHLDDESSLLPRDPEPLPESPVSPPVTLRHPESTDREHNIPTQAPAPGTFDSSLSESLAKIYIRQKRYDKAFEIIHTLSLNNPKKSSYFADQLRFLRKLMLNRSMK
ncbi:MAG: hypothetical protein HDS40_01280 [Bacteroides sp.]|nr:hypothetical protein [Bacteroides sp.]